MNQEGLQGLIATAELMAVYVKELQKQKFTRKEAIEIAVAFLDSTMRQQSENSKIDSKPIVQNTQGH